MAPTRSATRSPRVSYRLRSTGFPYGTYNICAKLGTKVGKVTNLDSKDKDGTDVPLSLTSSGTCP